MSKITIQPLDNLAPYIPGDEFRELKVRVNRVERELKKQQHNPQAQGMADEDYNQENDNDENAVPFDQVDKAIIAFVESKRREQGPNQSQIVEEIRKNHSNLTGTSRVTLIKRIGALVNYRVLNARPDSKNHQKRYYVNQGSLLLQLHKYFDSFEHSLINLIRVFVEKNGGAVTGQKREEVLFFTVIFELYQHVRGIAMTHATFSWSKVTNDPVLLNKLYRTLFAKLIGMQENLSKELEEANVDTYRNFVSSSWMTRPEVIDEGIAIAQKYDLPKEAISRVYELAWSIGAPVAKYARAKFEADPPSDRLAEIDDKNDAKINGWNSSRGWIEAYLYWKGQKEKLQK